MATSNETILARRALVVAAVALMVAFIALVAALLGDSGSDPAESAGPEPSQADVAAVRAQAEEAAAMADASAARAGEAVAMVDAAVARAAAAEEALAGVALATQALFDGDVDPAVLEALLAEAQAAAAAAQAAADDATTAEEAAAAETPPEDTDAAGDESQQTAEDGSEQPSPTESVPLPGEPSEFGPSAGAGLAVVGVRYDSALNVRDIPNGEIVARLDNVMDGVRDPVLLVRGADSDDIIDTLDLRQGVVATGNTRQLRTTVWHELRIGELVGWASAAYLAPLGADRDATAEVVEALGGTATAEALEDLGRQVAGVFESSGEVQSRTTVSSQPGVFEALGDITLDVLGLPDDSLHGYRISVGADAAQQDGLGTGPFTLRSVSVTPICDPFRGVSEDGVCQ